MVQNRIKIQTVLAEKQTSASKTKGVVGKPGATIPKASSPMKATLVLLGKYSLPSHEIGADLVTD